MPRTPPPPGAHPPVRGLIRAAAALSCAALAGCASVGNIPPLHEVETGLPGGDRVERGLFGLTEERRTPGGDREAVIRPLLVERVDRDGTDVRSIVPPIASHTVSDVRRRFTVWPVFSSDSAGSPAERQRGATDDDTWILPLLAWGSEPSRGDDRMLFPLYGKLHQKLFADELEFAAFPLWARTRTGGWSSTHVLWPLVAWGEGEGRSHARFLPFWSQTDSPAAQRRTALWPVLHWNVEQRGDRTFDGWFVFPFGGRRTSRDGTFSETTALWPFFQWSDDAANGDRHRGILWPFHKTVERPAAKTSSVWWWPLHGWYESPEESSSFWLWPVIWNAEHRADGRTSRRRFVVPVWLERESGPDGAAPDRREMRAWPLFSYEREPGGRESVRVPEIVPVFGWRAGETAYADLVALFRWSADAEGRAAWDGPLGGIVRWRRGADGASKLTLLWWIDVPTGGPR